MSGWALRFRCGFSTYFSVEATCTLKLEFQLYAGGAWQSNGCAREQTGKIDQVDAVRQVRHLAFQDHRRPIPPQHVPAAGQIERIRRPHPLPVRSEERRLGLEHIS